MTGNTPELRDSSIVYQKSTMYDIECGKRRIRILERVDTKLPRICLIDEHHQFNEYIIDIKDEGMFDELWCALSVFCKNQEEG